MENLINVSIIKVRITYHELRIIYESEILLFWLILLWSEVIHTCSYGSRQCSIVIHCSPSESLLVKRTLLLLSSPTTKIVKLRWLV